MIDIRTPRDLLAIIKRRRKHIILPLYIGLLGSLVAAVLWPPVFQSTAKILVQELEVSANITDEKFSSGPDHKIQVLTQRVMTAANLQSTVEKFDLYPSLLEDAPIEVAIEKIRGNIHWEILSAEVVDPQSARLTKAAIALQLAFNYRDPEIAQAVVTELVTLFLDDDKRLKKRKVIETSEFLGSEFDKQQDFVNRLADQIAAFKRDASGKLPDQVQQKVYTRDSARREILEIRHRIQALQEQSVYLNAKLAQIDRFIPSPSNIDSIDPAARLAALKVRFAWLRSRYSSEHPDALHAAQEIQELENQIDGFPHNASLKAERYALLSDLASLRQKYSDNHPDIVSIMHQIELLENSTRERTRLSAPTNPAFIELQARLEAGGMEIDSYKDQRKVLKTTITKVERELSEAPEIERKYNQLMRKYDAALLNLRNISEQRTQAKLNEQLEFQEKLEQFVVLENPTAPIEPIEPNRIAILVLGIIASLIFSLGMTVTAEFMDDSVYGLAQLAKVTNCTAMVAVPHIYTNSHLTRLWLLRILYGAVALSTLVLTIALVDSYKPFIGPSWSDLLKLSIISGS